MQDPKSFLAANLGRWLCQRTSYDLETSSDLAGRLEITSQWLDPSDPSSPYPDPAGVVGGLITTWQGTLLKPYNGKLILALREDGEARISQGGQVQTGCYQFQGGLFILCATHGETMTEERIWFGGTNLRMRTITLTRQGGFSKVSFFSEIRAGEAPAN
jgi:hypothetical protein